MSLPPWQGKLVSWLPKKMNQKYLSQIKLPVPVRKKNYFHATSNQLALMFNPLRFMAQLKIKFRKFLLKEN